METWVLKLREQAAGIAAGNYTSAGFAFANAPPGIAALSRDLDGLAITLEERELVRKALALEVHHRVKNNLQIVTSLLTMQANRIEHPAAREALGQTRARIGGLALIHRLLYEQVDDGCLAKLDVGRLIPDLCALFRLWNAERPEIALSSQSSAAHVPLDSALPLVLLAVEAVTNAYAYAFPAGRSGAVELRFGADSRGDAALIITDDGIGFDPDMNEGSMGRRLMLGFARQLGGKLAITSGSGVGTEVRLEYRISG